MSGATASGGPAADAGKPAVAVSAEQAPGVYRITVPTPFLVGPVNCYVLTGEPLTLIDTGPNSGTALDQLERGLGELGLRVEDLELIVLTHQHMDHEGLLRILQRRSGARVAAYAPLQAWLADYRASAKAETAYVATVLATCGAPADLLLLMRVIAADMYGYASSGEVTLPLHDGDTLRMGSREFRVHHRPGHSLSDLLFHDEHSGLVIGGDHLLAEISSNALITRPLEGETEGPRAMPLLVYADSMRATREMQIGQLLTGHGDPVQGHVELIDRRLEGMQRRARKILSLIESEPLSAHAIAQAIWGEVAITQAFLTLSEVLGHLDLLLIDGRAQATTVEGTTLFRAA